MDENDSSAVKDSSPSKSSDVDNSVVQDESELNRSVEDELTKKSDVATEDSSDNLANHVLDDDNPLDEDESLEGTKLGNDISDSKDTDSIDEETEKQLLEDDSQDSNSININEDNLIEKEQDGENEKKANDEDGNEKKANDEDGNDKKTNDEDGNDLKADDEDGNDKKTNYEDRNEMKANDEDENDIIANDEDENDIKANDEDENNIKANDEDENDIKANDEDENDIKANDEDENDIKANDEDENDIKANDEDENDIKANDEDENDIKANDEDENDIKANDEDENDKETNDKDGNPKEGNDDDDDDGNSKVNDDEKGKGNDDEEEEPQFEKAPNVTMESQADDSLAQDPFDALLKDPEPDDTKESTSVAEISITLDDEDDNNAEAGTSTTEVSVEPGSDEEICLLPDTEREISEADKAEAEKVLAEKQKEVDEQVVAKEEAPEVEPNENNVSAEDIQNSDEVETPATSQATAENENQAAENSKQSAELSVIYEISPADATCTECSKDVSCSYRFTKNSNTLYICTEDCLKKFLAQNTAQYTVEHKKFLIEEIEPKKLVCSECEELKTCFFYYKYDGDDTNYCSTKCLESMMSDEKDKYKFKRRKVLIHPKNSVIKRCSACNKDVRCSYCYDLYNVTRYVCSLPCINTLNQKEDNRYEVKKGSSKIKAIDTPLLKLKVISNATDKYLDEAYKIQPKTPAMINVAREDREKSFVRTCAYCFKVVQMDEKNLFWETMDFCNEACLGWFQNKIGSKCANCRNNVSHTSMGKYCVRFGSDIRQFCNSSCLDEFKKGLKICCYCQKDISSGMQGFLAPVGDKRQFKDFCSQSCMQRFDQMGKTSGTQTQWAKCAVCSVDKMTNIEVEVSDGVIQRLCSEPCFAAFKFVNTISPEQCKWCKKYFERKSLNNFTIFDGSTPLCFCSQSCFNIHISTTRHIIPCSWCKVKKYNYDVIKKNLANGQSVTMCSLNCLSLYQVSINAVSSRRTKCDMCKRTSLAQYHLTMSDATVRNFCNYQCVMNFQSQFANQMPILQSTGEPVTEHPKPTGAPRRSYSNINKTTQKQTPIQNQNQQRSNILPIISNVQSLAGPPPLQQATTIRTKSKRQPVIPPPEPEPIPPKTPPPPPKPPTPPPPPPPKVYNHVLVKTLPPKEVANKATLTKPMTVSRGISCRPHPCTKECQTDSSLERRILIPIPVPIYVPVPCAMYSLPFPVPVPIPIPIPTPVFIPTTRNSAKGIMKEISKIHDKMPTDPFEAELLMMAEMVAGDKKKESDSDTDDDNPAAEDGFSPVPMDGHNAFGEDMLQMALKMASEYEEPAVDLESAMTANTITPSSHPISGVDGDSLHQQQLLVLEQQRAVAALRAAAPRKRPSPASPAPPRTRGKRRRSPAPPPPDLPREPVEKPDANMCLKYTFGVNAWKQWVMTKNAEIEKSSIRRKPFKSEILQLTADELNYSLCLFVKEVRKPNGSEYAPDTIYYLVLGIQQYLFENSRIDNIFTDPYYEKFTDCLDEVAKKFSILYNDSQYIVTRVEEEHLWESKQLGAHSPHVLLSTLMFFNTKHFNLVTVEEHMQLSFSHIMKHWKRNPNQPGQAKMPGSRNVLLRFYPPQSALEANSRKKKVYEQQENEENPLRCPVKLYEFYISKCPESVRTRNDVFYLQPERSCVPDSPVWYSTQPLSRDALAKMLHRVKMVKEINIALLTS